MKVSALDDKGEFDPVDSDYIVRLHVVALTRALVAGYLTSDEFVRILCIFIKGL